MRVVSKSDVADHVFSAISKEEVEPISTFLQSKNVRLKNEIEDAMAMAIDNISDDDEDDDLSIPSEDEQRGKKGDKGKQAAKASRNDDDDDESGEHFSRLYGCQADSWQTTRTSRAEPATAARHLRTTATRTGRVPMRQMCQIR